MLSAAGGCARAQEEFRASLHRREPDANNFSDDMAPANKVSVMQAVFVGNDDAVAPADGARAGADARVVVLFAR